MFRTASALAVLAVAAGAHAAEAPAANGVDKTFEAWSLQCPPEGVKASCRVASSITVQAASGERQVATVVSVRPVAQAGRMQVSMQLPLTVWLPTGVTLKAADGGDIVTLPFVACSPRSCEAGAVLTAEQMARLKGEADRASAVYQLQTREQVKLDFSMKGFAPAVTAMTPSR